jgi:hypothetical protein
MFDEKSTAALYHHPSSPVSHTSKALAVQTSAHNTATADADEQVTQGVIHPLAVSNNRQPSPSDAAMFKSRPSLTQSPTTRSTAELLGAKTGKFDFFAAREENRVAVMGRQSSQVSAIRETLDRQHRDPVSPTDDASYFPTCSFPREPEIPQQSAKTTISEQYETTLRDTVVPTTSEMSKQQHSDLAGPDNAWYGDAQQSAWAASGEKFINSPTSISSDVPKQRTRLQSPELDMTSAYTFQQSKKANENRAPSDVRRRLQIRDLLDSPTPGESAAPSQPLPDLHNVRASAGSKRSFEDAFEPEDSQLAPLCIDAGTIDCSIVARESPQSSAAQATVPVTLSADRGGMSQSKRPTKKRRFAEVAACVALGGAGVLSALIMSAPSFT